MAKKISWYKIYDFKLHGKDPQEKNTVRTIEIESKRYALAFTGDNYYALDDRCPHAGGRFGSGGWCDHEVIVCPIHRHQYSLVSGRGNDGDHVETHPIEKREDGIYIAIARNKPWWWPF